MTWFDKIRLYLIYTTAVTLIILAVVFSVLRAVLPHATGYVDDLEQVLTEQTGLPVSIGSMDADMYWLVPRLKLVDVIIYDKGKKRELLHLDEAIFALAFVDSILQRSPAVGDISLVGADLDIERLGNNRWRVQGIDFGADSAAVSDSSASSDLINAVKNISFSLLDSNIHWRDYQLRSGQLDFIGANIFIEEFFGDHSLEINLQLPEIYGESLRLIVKTDDDISHLAMADLDVYLQLSSIDMGQWLSVVDIDGLPTIQGIVNGELWFARKANVFSQVVADASVRQLTVARDNQGTSSLDNAKAKLEWMRTDSGWSFNSRDIVLVKGGAAWPELASVSAVKDNTGLSVFANYLRVQDLLEIANVVVDATTLKSIKNYQLSDIAGDFYNLSAFLPADEKSALSLSTVFENLDFHVPDSEISFRGVDGSLSYIKGQVRLELLSESVAMDFGALFRQPLNADLIEGHILLAQEDNNWNISSDDLYLLNMDIEIKTRLKMTLREDGTLFADMQSDFINAIGSSIHKYYPVSIMSDELVAWLDMAITDGYVESGSFILHGDLNRFPYLENEGVMQVVLDASYLSLNFLEGWPTLNDLSSHIRFHNASLSITEASGQTYRGKMTQAKVLIPDLNAPRLFIDGHVSSPAEDLQHYVWDSGLNKILGSAMNQFQASGETELDIELEVPLDNDDEVLARGVLQLKGNELYLPVMDYALNNVTGRLSFEGDQLTANGVQAVFEGAPVNINVQSTEVSADTKKYDSPDKSSIEDEVISETVFSIKGNLPVDGMLKKFDWIPASWTAGASDWDVAVHLPKQTDDYSVRIEMSSDLQGTVISLSDAVSKPAEAAFPVNMEVKVLMNALQVDAKSGKSFSLFATRNDKNIWDFVVDSSLIRGSGAFAEDLNKNSTAFLDLEYVDLFNLFKSSKTGDGSISLKPTFFPSLKLNSKVLLWKDWVFNNAELDSSWHSHGMLINSIRLQGPSLKVEGRGSWLSSWQHEHESNFKLFVTSTDLGNTMSSLKLSDAMQGCEYGATVDWRWFDEPYKFSWQTVQGGAHFKMENGAVKDLDPGAGGRIVGLLNVFKLFDRLTLDFKDVASEGFAFDLIEGDFSFHDGVASSTNIEVSAAAADMRLTGDIGMVDKDYNMRMQVKPRSSAAAFTGGALAGGPVLGAGLVLINKLLGLEKSTYDEYKITGSWEKPLVEQVEERSVDNEGDQGAGE